MNPWTGHGGRLAAARAAYGDTHAPWIDLSTGINPHGWSGAHSVAIDWRALPDEAALAGLEHAAAAYFGIAPEHLCALPGTEIGLRLLGTLLPRPARYVAPSYGTHAAMMVDSVPVSFTALADGAPGTTILANPNNPDGRLTGRVEMAALLDRTQSAGGWLVVDEAFADVHPEASIAGRVGEATPLILFRSFGKFFGLAGLRLGFIAGPATIIARVRAMLGAWPLSTAAIAIGTAAYADADWIARMRMRLSGEADALDAVLLRHGLSPLGICPLFRLVETGDANALFDHLARRAILTRPFDHDPHWLRIGLPANAEALTRLDDALGQAVHSG
jgi:cobalamin biosynthetic protein CobC